MYSYHAWHSIFRDNQLLPIRKNMLKDYGPFASLCGNESFQTFHHFLYLGLTSGLYVSYSTHVSTGNGWFRGEQRSFPESSRVFFSWHMRMWEKNQDFFKQHVPWSSLPGTWNMKYLFTYSTHSWPTLAISWIDAQRSHLGELSNYRWKKPKAAQRLLSW